jgi:hypothetical protein
VERCLVCSHEFTRDGNRCPRCQWPIGFASITRDPRTDADVVNWAAMMYKKLIKIYEQQQVVTSNFQPNPPQPQTDTSALEARVQQLTTELYTFNGAYIQERHRCNRKIDELTKEVEFFKEIIQTSQDAVEKIANLERQYQEIIQRLVVQSAPAISQPIATLAPKAIALAVKDESIQIAPVQTQPISLPVFESIPEQTQPPEIKVPISPAERDLLDLYNRSADIPKNIRKDATDVSIDQDALNRLRDGDTSHLIFVTDQKGNFLVVRRDGYQYLVPNKKRPINSLIHKTVKSIYTCEGYHENYEQLTLVRPALVEEVASDRWQLGQKGVLKFK